jgi:HK97 family phage major capsid protein
VNINEIRERYQETVALMRGILEQWETAEEDMPEEEVARFDELQALADADQETIERYETRAARVIELERTGRVSTESDGQHQFQARTQRNPYDVSELRLDTSVADIRAHARTAIESDPVLPDEHKEAATQRLREVDVRGEVAVLILATGNPDYRTGWAKVMAGASWALTGEEQRALVRAQSLTGNAGGFAVPFTLDPTVILTNDGTNNPFRQISNVATITTDEWNGVSSAGATANWRAELVESTDDSITLAQPNIPVHKMDIFIPYSIEIEMDWAQMESEIRRVMVDAKDRLESAAFATGDGSGKPTGIVTALAGGASEINELSAGTFTLPDVFNLRRSLPPRYRPTRDAPSWVANIGTYDDIRQFDTGGGGGFWTDMMDGTPDRLLSYRTYESSEMDDAPDIAAGNNYIAVVGNFRAGYYIVDRIGMRVENIPHIFGANNRPSGQRGLYAIARVGADSVDDNAFRLLNITA